MFYQVLLISAGILSMVLAGPTLLSAEPDPALSFTVDVNGNSFINKGLVAFGLIPSNATESTGDTIGGIGSGIAIKRGTFKALPNGSFTGVLVVQPDRGFNIDGTIDYQGRQHDIEFVLTPYYGTADLSFADAQQTLVLKYKSTLLYVERNETKTTGLDALAIRPQDSGFPVNPIADPPMPIPFQFNHLSLDLEGLVLNEDCSFWVSDEYGPYIYRFSPSGQLIQTIQPPAAILPEVKNGALNFTSATDPKTGRAANQGFEGLTASPDGTTLYALLQSATIQDGGDSDETSRFTRLLKYDISNPAIRPILVGEWVVPLPVTNNKGKTHAQSETHFISENLFFVLARDGNGNGDSTTQSKYKQADIFDISNATDIHGTKFDDPANPIAKNGVLDSSITPAEYIPFVDFINSTQLARFGLHNGDPTDPTLIDAKWESLALAPCEDAENSDDYFLFTASDNDFISEQGIFDGQPFNAGMNVDNQFMVFRVTLPTVPQGSVQQSIGA